MGWATGWRGGSGANAGDASHAAAVPGASATEPPLIVHEWGTFTSFSGSNGVKLEFRPLEERDLPGFVFDRFRHSTAALFLKSSLPAIQRMETPVTYFYTAVERDVTVRVGFPEGLLTEFYPPVRTLAPKGVPFAQTDAAAPPLKDSWLDWGQVHLIPPAALRAAVQDEELSRRIGRHVERTMVPDAGTNQHYAAARDTDSAIVQVRHRPNSGTGVLPGDYFEKFLFYRGLGNFDLPLTLTCGADGVCTLVNSGQDELRSLFLVSVQEKALRFSVTPRIGAGETIELRQSADVATEAQLADAVVEALIAEGLFEKEARAMVRTWQDSWFREEGTRLFYILPQRLTDQLLPLTIAPPPNEQVRVLVGRMEIMTPSQETEILDLVNRSAAARNQAAKDAVSPVLPELLKLGRWGEPALVRVQNLDSSAMVKGEAQRLLAELRQQRDAEVDRK
jgi:hypothetical protein